MRDAQPQFWLWTIVLFLAFGVVYWRYAENELEKQKSAVMARQRAFAAQLEPRLHPLRSKIEGWVGELAGEWRGDVIGAEVSLAALEKSKGVYLRLRLEDASDPEAIRKAADHSLHDGFTSCLFVREARLALEDATRCKNPSDCPNGELCNEFDVCAPPSQPYNLRLMYRAMRILSSTWTDELHQATSDYKVRLFDRDLDKVSKTDVPIALEMTSRARYFTALLDEMPPEGLPKVAGINRDGGVAESDEMRLQALPHPVRLGIWDLESGEQIVRMRTVAAARFIPLGRSATTSLKTERAQQRQVNNCSVAQSLRERVEATARKPSDDEEARTNREGSDERADPLAPSESGEATSPSKR